MNSEPTFSDRVSIRQHMRQKRSAISPEQQLQNARNLCLQLMNFPGLQRAQNIAVYLANDGEIDPIVFATKLLHRGKTCYLPSLHPLKDGHLWFANYVSPRIKNRFGIEEPNHKIAPMINPKQLDVVLLPLVAFDRHGGRLGMGGGFYDRSFEFLGKGSASKPKLIGLAHDFQEVDQLPIESWDIPLSAIVTNKEIIRVHNPSEDN